MRDLPSRAFPSSTHFGLTKRELFAAIAMMGINADSLRGQHHTYINTAKDAVKYADALIAELDKKES